MDIKIGNRIFYHGVPYVMGILNVTPDSFSDGGNFTDIDKALSHVKKMIEDGADIIDVGGQSTKPGYEEISVGEEISRTCFVIEAIKENFDIPVSLDTYKSEVAKAGILAGADMINDIWGLKYDDGMAELVAKSNICCSLMHNRNNNAYIDFLADVMADIKASVAIAHSAGISDDKIIIDPGVGFAKDTEQSLLCMKELGSFCEMGYPILLGASNKSVIGNTLKLPVDDRLEGTITTSVYGYLAGATFFRVHDVKANRRSLDMAYAIKTA